VELDPDEMSKVSNRLKRAQGQLSAVIRMLDEGMGCEDVVTQLSAVSRALDRAGFAIIATELRASASKGSVTDDELDELERVFLSLA
jgi:DNA-binding FrmR family transcriptional regulator